MVGDVAATLRALAPLVADKARRAFLREHVTKTERCAPAGSGTTSPRDPASSRSGRSTWPPSCRELADDDALFFADTGTPASGPPGTSTTAATAGCSARSPGRPWPAPRRTPSARARLPRTADDRPVRRRRLHHARAGRPADPGAAQGPVVNVILTTGCSTSSISSSRRRASSRSGPSSPTRTSAWSPTALGAQRHPGRGTRRRTRRPAGGAHPHRRTRRGRRGGGPLCAGAALPRARPQTAEGFTLSIAKQVLNGKMDDVIDTARHNVRLL